MAGDGELDLHRWFWIAGDSEDELEDDLLPLGDEDEEPGVLDEDDEIETVSAERWRCLSRPVAPDEVEGIGACFRRDSTLKEDGNTNKTKSKSTNIALRF